MNYIFIVGFNLAIKPHNLFAKVCFTFLINPSTQSLNSPFIRNKISLFKIRDRLPVFTENNQQPGKIWEQTRKRKLGRWGFGNLKLCDIFTRTNNFFHHLCFFSLLIFYWETILFYKLPWLLWRILKN